MNKLISAALISISLVFVQIANAGLHEDSAATYQREHNETAARVAQLAAGKGDRETQNNLGHIDNKGLGRTRDFDDKLWLYQLGAEQGDAWSQNNLGDLYEERNGGPGDYQEAMKWYRLAAKQGHHPAQKNLGIMYVRGSGVTKNNMLAYMWLYLAAQSGDEKTVMLRQGVAKKLSRTQMDTALEMAQLCQQSQYKNCN